MIILREDLTDEGYTDIDFLDASRLIGVDCFSGVRLGHRFPAGLQLVIVSTHTPNDFFMAGSMPVVSERLKQLFDQFNADVEYHSLAVRLHDGSLTPHSYYYANVLSVLDCLDWAHSLYVLDRGFATSLRRVRLLAGKDAQSPVYLVAKTIPSLICLRDDIAGALPHSGCQVIHSSPQEWRNPACPEPLP